MSTISAISGYTTTAFTTQRRESDRLLREAPQEVSRPVATLPSTRDDARTQQAEQAGQAVDEAFAKMRLALQNPEAQSTAGAQGTAEAEEGEDVVQAFMDYMAMSPEQKIRDSLLKDMGLTEEELDALPPEQQAKIEAQIAEKLSESVVDSAQQATQAQSLQAFPGSLEQFLSVATAGGRARDVSGR